MRKVTIQYNELGDFVIEDDDNTWVSVQMSEDGDTAYFVSFPWDGEEEAVADSCHKDDAMAQALLMMGVLV